MRYTKRFVRIALAVCLILPLCLVMAPTCATCLNVVGTYAGTFAGSMNSGSVVFEIAAEDDRRFMGMVTMVVEGTVFPLPFELEGTQDDSPCHGFNGTGKGMAGHLEFHGDLHPLPGGFLLIEARYKFMSAGGMLDEGTVTATNAPGPAP
jgi:hypothetical protein